MSNEHIRSEAVQITYREEQETPDQRAFSSVHLSSPLGGIEGGESNIYKPPKRIPASRRLKLNGLHSFRDSKNPPRSNADKINSFAIRVGLDYLNREYHQKKKIRTVADVESHIFTILCEKLDPLADYDAYTNGGKGYITYGMIERYAERAAAYTVEVWRPDYFEMQAKRGEKGGRKSKRKPMYTYADFLKVEGLTHAEAAAMLGVSVMTVRRMREKYGKHRHNPIVDPTWIEDSPPDSPDDVSLDALLE